MTIFIPFLCIKLLRLLILELAECKFNWNITVDGCKGKNLNYFLLCSVRLSTDSLIHLLPILHVKVLWYKTNDHQTTPVVSIVLRNH